MGKPSTFLELVELHERKWGTLQYPGRPTLTDLMTSPIVAVWAIDDKRFIFSAHAYQGELDDLVSNVLIGKIDDGRKLAQIFVGQQPAQFHAGITYQIEDNGKQPQAAQKPGEYILPPGVIRTPAGDKLKPGRHSNWLPGRNPMPVMVIKNGPARYLYECPRCHAIQDAVKIEGSPKCPACGHEMVMKT
jgi:DNA-directed RNA polymerase subunit RPC12/RpoP